MTYVATFGPGWHREDTPDGPRWYAIPEPEPASEGVTIPEGYVELGYVTKD